MLAQDLWIPTPYTEPVQFSYSTDNLLNEYIASFDPIFQASVVQAVSLFLCNCQKETLTAHISMYPFHLSSVSHCAIYNDREFVYADVQTAGLTETSLLTTPLLHPAPATRMLFQSQQPDIWLVIQHIAAYNPETIYFVI